MKMICLSLLAAASVMACSKDESKSPAASATRLSAADLAAPANVDSLSAVELNDELNQLDLLATEKDDNASEAVGDGSESECFSSSETPAVVAKGENLNFDMSLDVSACMQALFNESQFEGIKVEIHKALITTSIAMSCKGGDLGSFDAKNISDVDFVLCADGSVFSNSKFELVSKITVGDKVIQNSAVAISSQSTADNQPCRVTKDGTIATLEDGCTEISKTIVTGSEPEVSFAKLVSKSLRYNDVNLESWYLDGSVTATVSDWSGTITFAGMNNAPQYVMRRGSEVSEGNATGPVELRMKKSVTRFAEQNAGAALKKFKARYAGTRLPK